jgi:5,10-methylenetetrahydromethanopterin reductase
VKGSADSVLTSDQLVDVSSVLPDEWISEAAAVGSAGACFDVFERYLDAGADELVLHGSTPDQLGVLLG